MTRRAALGSLLSLAFIGACGGGGSDAATPPAPSPSPLPAGWARLADLPAGLAKFGAAAVGGRLYVVGGYDARRSLYVYDIAANSWSSGPNLPQGSDNLAVLEREGRIWALGGEAGTAVQVFDPATQTWATGPVLPAVRFAAAAATLDGALHIAGGWNYNNTASASLTRHDRLAAGASSWASAAALATARNAAGAAALGGRLYVVGGRSPGIRAGDQASLASVEVYDPATGAWTAGAPLPTARGSLAVAALGGRLYAMGGESTPGTVSDAVERFDPATLAWSALTAMPLRAHGLAVVAVGDSLYVMGGFTGASDAVGTESRALYRYTPPA
jgi:N-acetylneuraminic acid mutarotase